MTGNKRLLCLDPAGESFGIAVLELQNDSIYIPMTFLLTSPLEWDISRKNSYMAHCTAALISLEKPDIVVSEKPWGIGYSKDSLLQLIGAIKAETWSKIEWQGVSEARKGVLGDGYGAADKYTSAEWLQEYPFSRQAKNFIKGQLESVDKETKNGYDILDAIMHGVYYMVDNGMIQPVHKVKKETKRKKKSIIGE